MASKRDDRRRECVRIGAARRAATRLLARMTFLGSGRAPSPSAAGAWYGTRLVPRAFSPAILRLAAVTSRPPEEVDAAVYRARSQAWVARRAFVGEAEALEQVGLMLSVAEVVVEDAVRRFLAAGAVIPEVPPPRWGLRRRCGDRR